MFHTIPQPLLDRMKYLEEIDSRDRVDGTERMKRLRQIPPQTGKFLALTAASAPSGKWLEIGTSAGYSTLWLALAARIRQQKIITFEILNDKFTLAQETFRSAQVEDVVELINGDARELIADYSGISFCFLDAEKEVYQDCYDLIIPRMVPGGILIADNLISHAEELQSFSDRVENDVRVDSVLVPIGKGELVCRRNSIK